ncbi:hypothetical protein [Desulfoplanes formicivorans]|uniref:TraB family protein n=1 Tax=Desulfoplanes formicivorans TaxID=1592317 RepID=A0A194AHE5_9BACT|nr:hypothetical protein [Desulfoplanes formicivorans]GAU08753.1 hypothetical protein DPF_1469 [Desulfoplanes formicivorans]
MNKIFDKDQKKIIYLLGIYHIFQIEHCVKFSEYIRNFCIQHNIKSIAEEMSSDALEDAGIVQSTVFDIAVELGLPHEYCDPPEVIRKERRILGERDIEYKTWRDELPNDDKEGLKLIHFRKRELYWVEKLLPIYVDPMLFVCGAAHLSTFPKLLEENGFHVQILDKKWEPNLSAAQHSQHASK